MASFPVEKLLKIRTLDGPAVGERDDPVAVEYPLTVFLDGQELATLLCTPEHLEDLVVGFLFGQGLIAGPDDVGDVTFEAETGRAEVRLGRPVTLADRLYARRVIASGCGAGGSEFYSALDALQVKPLPGRDGGQGSTAASSRLPASTILAAARRLQTDSPLFRATGGVHTAVLAGPAGETIVTRDDIGRHNAVDKVLGHMLGSGGGHPAPGFLMVTGRVSSDIALKAVRGGIPVVASRSAPTSLAVELAEKLNLTVAGFVRGRRMNLYSAPWRVDPSA